MSSERSEQPGTPDNHGGMPGRTLAAQREAMGWTVEQVADQLKLAVRQVVALEAGDYAHLPSPAVTRGFVRAYAKILKLDPVPLVAMIAQDTPATGNSASAMRRERPASFSEVRFPSNGKRRALPLGLIAGAVLVLAAAAAAWQFGLSGMLAGDSDTPAAATTGNGATTHALPAPGAASATPASETTLLNPSVPLISVPPPGTSAAAGGATPGSPAGVGQAAGAPAAAAGPALNPGASANALVISVREDSWIEVRRASGGTLLARMVKGGSTETLDVTEPVTLIVGKPSAVGATLRGAPVELPPLPGKSVARVTLK